MSKYIPSGPRANVRGTYFKNERVQDHVRTMHCYWQEQRNLPMEY